MTIEPSTENKIKMEIVRINNEIKPLFWIALQKIWYQNAAFLQKPKRKKKKDGKAFWINLIMAKHLFFFTINLNYFGQPQDFKCRILSIYYWEYINTTQVWYE